MLFEIIYGYSGWIKWIVVCEVGSKVNRLLLNYVKFYINIFRESNSFLYMRFDFKEFYMGKYII